MDVHCFSIMHMKHINSRIGTLFIISAPSGAGKTTVVNAVMEKMAGTYPLKRLITYTSRAPRAGEKNGIDYHFVSPDTFKALLENNFFLEYSCSYGSYYGTSRSLLEDLEMGTSYCAIVDRAGAQLLAQLVEQSVTIWIYTKNLAVLENRLKSRNAESPEIISKRLAIARAEITQEIEKPFFHHYILNDSLKSTINQLKSIIFKTLGNAFCSPNSKKNKFLKKDF